jgi:hypothetical protein
VAFTSGMVGDTGNWSQDNGNWSSFSTNLLAEPVITDIDGDGISDVVGLSSNGDTIVASAWRLLNDSKGTEILYLGSAELGASTEAHQIIRCDYGGSEDYFALVGDGKNETIYRLSVSTSGVDEEASTATNGTIMHCGEGWDTNAWTPYVVVVSSSAGSWTSYRRALGSEDSGSMGSIGDFAMLPNEVVGCSEDGCSMLATDLDGDEILELVTMDSTGLTVEWGDGSEPSVHAGSGLLTVQDADGDGREDILATDVETGRIWIYRNLVNGIAPAVGLHTIRDLTSRVSLGDVTADGVPELILVDADGRIIHSEATEADPASSW